MRFDAHFGEAEAMQLKAAILLYGGAKKIAFASVHEPHRDPESGIMPAPMPWILCGPGFSGAPASFCVMTGLPAGSTATDVIAFPRVCLM